MAKTGERVAGSNRDRVRRWLEDHPGQHRCQEVAAELGLSTHQVAIACYGLYEQGAVLRGTRQASNGGRPFKTYGLNPETVAAR